MLIQGTSAKGLARILSFRPAWPLIASILLILAVACSSYSSPEAVTPSEPIQGTGIPAATDSQLPGGPQYSVVLAASDLSLGSNRVAFGLIDRNGMPLRSQEAQVEAVFLPAGQAQGEVRATAQARFVKWPIGNQGVFTTQLEFDQAGPCTTVSPDCWVLRVSTIAPDGTPVQAVGNFAVNQESKTPAIGSPAPASVTPTAGEVEDLATITSSTTPDPDLYELSVHQALAQDKPLVVVFATPAFCVIAACGPQVEVVSQLKDQNEGRANFIHIEVFKDPHLIEGNRPSPDKIVPAVGQWNLPTEPWTFIVDSQGLVQAKFESFTTLEELQDGLDKVIGG